MTNYQILWFPKKTIRIEIDRKQMENYSNLWVYLFWKGSHLWLQQLGAIRGNILLIVSILALNAILCILVPKMHA